MKLNAYHRPAFRLFPPVTRFYACAPHDVNRASHKDDMGIVNYNCYIHSYKFVATLQALHIVTYILNIYILKKIHTV